MATSWAKAEGELAGINQNRKIRVLEDRVRQLQRQLAAAATSAEHQRSARALKIPRNAPRSRCKSDYVRVAVGDLHGCKMNVQAVTAFLTDVRSLAPDEIILGGDIADCGGFLAQHHVMGYVAETDYSYEEDIAAANQFLDDLQKAAPQARILFLEGNHENRPERWIITQTLRHARDARYLRNIMGPDVVMRLKERGVQFFARNEIHGDCRQPGFLRRDKCFFVHEISSSTNAAADALRKVAGNVVFFHTHRADAVTSFRPNVGDIGAWNPGCLCTKRPMWMHTRVNDWTNGYAVQFVNRQKNFLHINVPIVDGQSLLLPFTERK